VRGDRLLDGFLQTATNRYTFVWWQWSRRLRLLAHADEDHASVRIRHRDDGICEVHWQICLVVENGGLREPAIAEREHIPPFNVSNRFRKQRHLGKELLSRTRV